MLGFAFHTSGADVTQGMRAPVTSVPLRHRANHGSGVAGRRFRPIRCYRIEISVMTRDGVRLGVHDGGPRRAEHTVVFLHGFCLTGASWSHQIDYLLRRYGEHVRVISYDHRGHGRSSGAPISTHRSSSSPPTSLMSSSRWRFPDRSLLSGTRWAGSWR
jgi:hypothetical protein